MEHSKQNALEDFLQIARDCRKTLHHPFKTFSTTVGVNQPKLQDQGQITSAVVPKKTGIGTTQNVLRLNQVGLNAYTLRKLVSIVHSLTLLNRVKFRLNIF